MRQMMGFFNETEHRQEAFVMFYTRGPAIPVTGRPKIRTENPLQRKRDQWPKLKINARRFWFCEVFRVLTERLGIVPSFTESATAD